MKISGIFKSGLALIILSTFLFSCSQENDMMENPTPANGTPIVPTETTTAPDFTLKSLDGSDISLSDYKNKVVVLFFFGNSCPTCKAVAPSIESELAVPFKNNDSFQILGLDQWDGNSSAVEGFRKSTNVTFPLLLKASPVASLFKTTYDRLIVINKEGEIVFTGKQNGASDLKAVREKVDEIL